MLRRSNCCTAQGGADMATVIQSRPVSGLAQLNPATILRRAMGRAVTYWQARRRRSRELSELFAFDERELRDLGLSRSDFISIENGTYRRET
jgi:uncharacterized protein YjiS (DUF1127 family)